MRVNFGLGELGNSRPLSSFFVTFLQEQKWSFYGLVQYGDV